MKAFNCLNSQRTRNNLQHGIRLRYDKKGVC